MERMKTDLSPYLLAAEVYEREPCARTFAEDIIAHLEGGYVVNSPTVFLMFRPVARAGEEEEIVNPWRCFPAPDCWHVYLASGDSSEFASHFPFPLPWVSFERKNRLRFHRFRHFKGLLSRASRHGNLRTPLRH
jgi:hypothetical protein